MDQMATVYNGSQSHNQTHSRSRSLTEAARPPNKRKRIARTCEACRQRKSRCYGSRPKCDFCAKQGMPCFCRDAAPHYSVYPDRHPQPPVPAPVPVPAPGSDGTYLIKLEGRLREMESILQSLMPSRQIASAPMSSGSEGKANANPNTNAHDESPTAHNMTTCHP